MHGIKGIYFGAPFWLLISKAYALHQLRHPEGPRFYQRVEGSRVQGHSTEDPSLRSKNSLLGMTPSRQGTTTV